jgi:hypothetical protein
MGERQTFMHLLKVSGVVLLGLAIVALADQGVSYKTTDKIVNFGLIQVRKTNPRSERPILAAIAWVGGFRRFAFAAQAR